MRKYLIVILFLFQIHILSAKEGSVVCIHGFLRSSRCMKPIGRSFQKLGLDAYLWDYESRRYTIQEHALHLLSILNEIATEKPGEPIHFVAHSLGSLITRAALNHPDCPAEAHIGRIVLLAPPNNGSSLGRRFKDSILAKVLFGSKSGLELMSYTPEEMKALGTFPDTVKVMVLSGCKGVNFWFDAPNDGILLVEETLLETPCSCASVYVSHGRIMRHKEAMRLCINFIIEESP